MHQDKCKHHYHDGAKNPAFRDGNQFKIVDFRPQRKTDAHNAPDNRLRGGCGNSKKRRQSHEKTGTDQCNANRRITQIGFYNTLADGVHDMLALEQSTQKRKDRHQDDGIFK